MPTILPVAKNALKYVNQAFPDPLVLECSVAVECLGKRVSKPQTVKMVIAEVEEGFRFDLMGSAELTILEDCTGRTKVSFRTPDGEELAYMESPPVYRKQTIAIAGRAEIEWPEFIQPAADTTL